MPTVLIHAAKLIHTAELTNAADLRRFAHRSAWTRGRIAHGTPGTRI